MESKVNMSKGGVMDERKEGAKDAHNRVHSAYCIARRKRTDMSVGKLASYRGGAGYERP
jgi:hypothetical protein